MFLKPDLDTLVEYVKERLEAGVSASEAVDIHTSMLAQSAYYQEVFEQKVKEYKEYWIKNNAEKPFGWFPWKISLKIERR